MFVTSLRIKASESLDKNLAKKKNGEMERKRALHNLRMLKNISDTLAYGSCATSLF